MWWSVVLILSPSVEDVLKYVAYISVLNTFKNMLFEFKQNVFFARTKL